MFPTAGGSFLEAGETRAAEDGAALAPSGHRITYAVVSPVERAVTPVKASPSVASFHGLSMAPLQSSPSPDLTEAAALPFTVTSVTGLAPNCLAARSACIATSRE